MPGLDVVGVYTKFFTPSVIACQFNDIDNDSANLTEIILFENYLSGTNSFDITGYYNLQSTNSIYFRELSLSQSAQNKLQPDINFNPYNSTFMVTYFDSTDHKLPFLTHDFNMINPNSWGLITPAYNDTYNITSPNPKVRINITKQEGMNGWNADGSNDLGKVMFDSPYSIYTGTRGICDKACVLPVTVYPNPCSERLTFSFEVKKSSRVTILLYNIYGRQCGIISDDIYKDGKHQLVYPVSQLEAGTYFYEFQTDEFVTLSKFVKINSNFR